VAEDLACYRRVARPRFSLVCLPHAGGNATAFQGWTAYLPQDIGLYAARYPGRMERMSEPAARTVAELAGPLASAVTAIPHPVVVLGHSMGAVIAHAVTVLLERDGRGPRELAVCGREAPHLASPLPSPTDDDSLIAMCRALGGVPEGLLDDDEGRELVLAPLRADTRVLNAEIGAAVPPVAAPIAAYLGADDAGCTTGQIDGWRVVTTGPFRRRVLPGGHFTVLARPAELLGDLCRPA
jgi:pyochelin biosynthetic protein PchC